MSGLERREIPMAGTEKVHILDVDTFFMWVSKKLQGDVRMCPAVPEQRVGGRGGGGVEGGTHQDKTMT